MHMRTDIGPPLQPVPGALTGRRPACLRLGHRPGSRLREVPKLGPRSPAPPASRAQQPPLRLPPLRLASPRSLLRLAAAVAVAARVRSDGDERETERR
ncbi:unnamed protein product [Urochloa humidicola]